MMVPDAEQTTVHVEWRVTADPDHFDFTWSPLRNPHLGDAEAAARQFIEQITRTGHMRNVRLMRRTVTVEPWEDTPA